MPDASRQPPAAAALTVESLLDCKRYLEVAHHVPGRLRLRFSPRLIDHPAAAALGQDANALSRLLPGFLSARVNPLARSIVALYDADRLDPALLERFFRSRDPEEERGLLAALNS